MPSKVSLPCTVKLAFAPEVPIVTALSNWEVPFTCKLPSTSKLPVISPEAAVNLPPTEVAPVDCKVAPLIAPLAVTDLGSMALFLTAFKISASEIEEPAPTA